MSIFGPGWFGTRTPLRGYGGKVLRVLHPETGLPVPTVSPVTTNADGFYDQFDTVSSIDHVILSDGRHEQSATRIGVALADPGTYPTREDLQAVEAKADQALADSGTSGLPTRQTAIPGVLRIEQVKKP